MLTATRNVRYSSDPAYILGLKTSKQRCLIVVTLSHHRSANHQADDARPLNRTMVVNFSTPYPSREFFS
jgi:hypothetical protein